MPDELNYFIIAVLIFGFLGYILLQLENLWFKVVGGTLTVLLVLWIPAIVVIGFVLDNAYRY
tara:strand:+ start:2384 stop:2569 length:186 start_codon:yes stop_codon:yes gene_type:complete